VPLVLAIVKAQETFPSMITVGRTANNDVVIPDTQVSRFHAFFRVAPGEILLEDAGSSNGTWVGDTRVAKGAPARLSPGAQLRFAGVELELINAADCWNRLVEAQDNWG